MSVCLAILPVWSESSLCAEWVAKDPRFLHADSKDSDQTERMPRLNWVFSGRTVTLLVLSCRGSLCHWWCAFKDPHKETWSGQKEVVSVDRWNYIVLIWFGSEVAFMLWAGHLYSQVVSYEPPHDKTNKLTVRPAKTQISLGICPVWPESSLCAQWVAKDLSFLHADSEDFDQTGQ